MPFQGMRFWIDASILLSLWISTFFVPNTPFVFDHLTLQGAIKIVALFGAIEMIGIISNRLMKKNHGLIVQGFLGGLISSTVTFVQLTRHTENQSAQSISQALIFATIAMLLECLLIIFTLHPTPFPIMIPLIVQMGILWVMTLMSHGETSAAFTRMERIKHADKINWGKVILLSSIICASSAIMRFLSESISISFTWTAFLLSFLEAHSIISAVVTSHAVHTLAETKMAVASILTGHIISKTFFVLSSRQRAIRLPVLTALYASLLGALLTSGIYSSLGFLTE